MTEPDDMAPGPDGRVPGTMATVLDLTCSQPALDPEMNFSRLDDPGDGDTTVTEYDQEKTPDERRVCALARARGLSLTKFLDGQYRVQAPTKTKTLTGWKPAFPTRSKRGRGDRRASLADCERWLEQQ